jgi:lycopene cyclase domain-containing protein
VVGENYQSGGTGGGCGMIDRWQYLIVLGACLVITAPLEFFGPGVYRQPVRTLKSIIPIAALFLIWDAIAIGEHIWWYNPRYMTGLTLAADIPIEEVLFFVVIPLCGLLTLNAVGAMLDRVRRVRSADHAVRQR